MMDPAIPDRTHRPVDPSIGGTLASLALLAVVVAFVANPVSTTALVIGLAAGLYGLRYGLTALARRATGTTQKFSVPGVGTVEYRITPR